MAVKCPQPSAEIDLLVRFCPEDSALQHSGPFGCRDEVHNMIVSPRAGPTLTIEGFAPASSEMYLTYFLAAEGSCENLRAVFIDVFQPATSS